MISNGDSIYPTAPEMAETPPPPKSTQMGYHIDGKYNLSPNLTHHVILYEQLSETTTRKMLFKTEPFMIILSKMLYSIC